MLIDEYKTWIDKAEDNIKYANGNFKRGYYPLVCYLCQQSVELALKGFLYKKEKIAPKIHDLVRIYDECKKYGLVISKELDKSLDKLTDYYFESRYPDMLNEELNDVNFAKEALESSTQIVEEIKKQL